MMSDYDIREKMTELNYLKVDYKKISIEADKLINTLKTLFDEKEIQSSKIEKNSFEFSYWGFSFMIKSEISFEDDLVTLKKGELNTYLKIEDKLHLIISYGFNKDGKIEEDHNSIDNDPNENIVEILTQKTFAYPYFFKFVSNFKAYSKKENLKFQLI
jgi:hypothetical protein